jgi:isoleucyl-tRNA synthetase
VVDATEAFDRYDLFGACQVVREFFDALTNWYVRRSRSRFWEGDPEAIDTLHTVMTVLVRVAAPLLPFITEGIHRGMHPDDDSSVHLLDWPDVVELPDDDELVERMDLVRDICSATLSVRKAHNRRVRLPLSTLTVASPDAEVLAEFTDVIADEVNVRDVALTSDVASIATEQLQLVPAKLGPRLGKEVQNVIKAHKAGDWHVADDGAVVVGGTPLLEGEYSLGLVAGDDQASASLPGQQGVIALDIEVTDDLAAEGRARDLIRVVQQARRDAGLDVSDRVALTVRGASDVVEAGRRHEALIAGETLATSVDWTLDDDLDEPSVAVERAGAAVSPG